MGTEEAPCKSVPASAARRARAAGRTRLETSHHVGGQCRAGRGEGGMATGRRKLKPSILTRSGPTRRPPMPTARPTDD
eukprot:364366-Chlamydomonas_euryale.AAC.5